MSALAAAGPLSGGAGSSGKGAVTIGAVSGTGCGCERDPPVLAQPASSSVHSRSSGRAGGRGIMAAERWASRRALSIGAPRGVPRRRCFGTLRP